MWIRKNRFGLTRTVGVDFDLMLAMLTNPPAMALVARHNIPTEVRFSSQTTRTGRYQALRHQIYQRRS
jgi:hypothetical protein